MRSIIIPLLILLANFSSSDGIAQNILIVGEKSYSCTPTWIFKNNSTDGRVTENPSVCVAKNGDDGILFVEVKTLFSDEQIISPCILYLQDNSVITCSTIIGRDKVDGKTSAMFKLTKTDITKLKTNQINTIRYTLQTPSGIPNWENEKYAYTANCISTYKTNENIRKLFEIQKSGDQDSIESVRNADSLSTSGDQDYLESVRKADSLFNAGNFQLAKEKYRLISVRYPDYYYPLSKIKECDQKLNPASKNDTLRPQVQDTSDYHNEIARTYPEGIPVIKDSTSNTEKRIVVFGDKVYIYTKKSYSWGTFYFKDGIQISEATFNYETSPAYIKH